MLSPSAPITAIHTRLATDRKYSWSVNGITRKNRMPSAATVHRAMGSRYSAMSASYVVFRTPHSRWIMARLRAGETREGAASVRLEQATSSDEHDEARGRSRPERTRLYVRVGDDRERSQAKSIVVASYALDDFLAENAVWANHQRGDHQHVRREVFGAAADVGIDVPGGEIFHHADDEPAQDRAGNGVEPAENHDRKHLEAHEREVHVDPEEIAPENAAERRDDAGHRPRHAEVALDVDPHGQRDLLVVGHRAHRDALARLQEEPAEGGQEADAHAGAEQLDRRNEQRSHEERLLADGQRQRLRPGKDRKRSDASQNRRQADGGHDDGDDRPADQLAQHDALEREAQDHHARQRE